MNVLWQRVFAPLSGEAPDDWYGRTGLVLVAVICLLLPMVATTVGHGASTSHLVFAVWSLGTLGSVGLRWQRLDRDERLVLIGLIVLFLAPLLSLVNGDDGSMALKRYERLVKLVLAVPMYLLVRGIAFDFSRVLVAGCVLAGPVMAAVAVYESAMQDQLRAVGAYNSIPFGQTAAVVAVVTLTAVATGRPRSRVAVPMLVSASLAGLAVFMSGTRGVWLALILAVPVFAWVVASVRGARLHRVALSSLAVLAILAVASYPVIEQRMDEAVTEMQGYLQGAAGPTDVGDRLQMLELALEVWAEHPVLGTGLGDYGQELDARVDAGQMRLLTRYTHAHSLYFESLAATGLLGLVVQVLGLFVFPALLFARRLKAAPAGGSAVPAAAGLMLVTLAAGFGLTDMWLAGSSFTSTYAVMLVVLLAGAVREGEWGKAGPPAPLPAD